MKTIKLKYKQLTDLAAKRGDVYLEIARLKAQGVTDFTEEEAEIKRLTEEINKLTKE